MNPNPHVHNPWPKNPSEIARCKRLGQARIERDDRGIGALVELAFAIMLILLALWVTK